MRNVQTQFNKLAPIDFPNTLHNKIIRSVFFLKLRTRFFVIAMLLLINLLTAGSRILIKMVAIDGVAVLKILFENFEFDFTYVIDTGKAILELFPVTSIIVFSVSAVSLGYLAYLYFTFKKLIQKNPSALMKIIG